MIAIKKKYNSIFQECLKMCMPKDDVQTALQYFQEGRLQDFSRKPVPVLNHPYSKEVYPDIQTELPVL